VDKSKSALDATSSMVAVATHKHLVPEIESPSFVPLVAVTRVSVDLPPQNRVKVLPSVTSQAATVSRGPTTATA